MMVGRALDGEQRMPPDTSANEVVLEVRGSPRPRHPRRQLPVAAGEILGFAGLMGAGRTEVARAIFGADPLESGEIIIHGGKAVIRQPADAVAHGIGYLSEDRKHFGLAVGMDVQANIALSSMGRFTAPASWTSAPSAKWHRATRQLAIKTPSVEQQARLLGRQPAEDRDCQVVAARLRHPVLR
jgi:ribose transport system ATP-binding protein